MMYNTYDTTSITHLSGDILEGAVVLDNEERVKNEATRLRKDFYELFPKLPLALWRSRLANSRKGVCYVITRVIRY